MPKAATTYNLSALFRKAWSMARYDARFSGKPVMTHFAAALRQAWAATKAEMVDAAYRAVPPSARVMAEIERIRAERAFPGPVRPAFTRPLGRGPFTVRA